MHRLSIFTKLTIFLGFITTLITVLAAYGILQIVFFKAEIQNKSELISKHNDILTLAKPEKSRELADFLRSNDLSLLIFDDQAKVIARYGIYRNLTVDTLHTLSKLKNDKDSYQDVEMESFGLYDVYTANNIQVAGKNKVLPILKSSFLIGFLIILPVIWLVSLIFSYMSTRLVLSPFNTFVQLISNIDINNFSKKIFIQGNYDNQLNILVNSFNGLMDKIYNFLTIQKKINNSISHELKTPLTRAVTNLQIAEDSNTKNVKTILRSTSKELIDLGKNVDAILELSLNKLQSKQKIKTNITEVLKIHLAEIPKHIKVTNNINDSLKVAVPKPELSIILRNLIDNAIKYNTEFGFIKIYSNVNHRRWKLTIENSISNNKNVRSYKIGSDIIKNICIKNNLIITFNENKELYKVELTGKFFF